MEERLTKRERRELKRQQKADSEVSEVAKKRLMRNIFVVIGIIAVILIIVIVRAVLTKDIESISSTGNDPSVGNPDARVVIREYSDFECPACRTSALSLAKVVQEYSADEVYFTYNDFPIIQLHKNSQKAAIAAQCANKQEKFWEYHDRLFLDQAGWKELEDPRDKFIAYANAFELDSDMFAVCIDEEQTKYLVEEDFNEARELDINSTPTYFINGIRYVGAKDENGWRDLIDSFLK